jgi:hypothetical protein
MRRTVGLVEHYERHFGEIDRGWDRDADGRKAPFQVVRFSSGSEPGTVAFATLGLWRYPLDGPAKSIRHELLMIIPDGLRESGAAPRILHQVAMEALESGKPLLRGDVIGPRGGLFENSRMQALYAAIPVYLPDDFAGFTEEGKEGAIVWLVPISPAEAHFVAHFGWNRFEDLLVSGDPDLTDVFRPEVSLPRRLDAIIGCWS